MYFAANRHYKEKLVERAFDRHRILFPPAIERIAAFGSRAARPVSSLLAVPLTMPNVLSSSAPLAPRTVSAMGNRLSQREARALYVDNAAMQAFA